MPEITMPDVKLPKIELPEGLREMTADDIVRAMPEMKRPKIELPSRADISKRLDKLDLPKVEARQKRSGRPWLAIAAVAGVLAGTWMLLSSSNTGPRIRSWMAGIRQRFEQWGEQMNQRANFAGTGTTDDTVAFSSAERAEVQPDPYADDLPIDRTGKTDRSRPLTEGIGTESA